MAKKKTEERSKPMGFIDKALDDAVEKEVLPEAESYDLVIGDAEIVRSKSSGKERVSVRIIAEGYPNAKSIFHSLAFIEPDDEEEKANNKLLFARAFIKAFKVPVNPKLPWNEAARELDVYYGCRARLPLTIREYEGVESNQLVLRI